MKGGWVVTWCTDLWAFGGCCWWLGYGEEMMPDQMEKGNPHHIALMVAVKFASPWPGPPDSFSLISLPYAGTSCSSTSVYPRCFLYPSCPLNRAWLNLSHSSSLGCHLPKKLPPAVRWEMSLLCTQYYSRLQPRISHCPREADSQIPQR